MIEEETLDFSTVGIITPNLERLTLKNTRVRSLSPSNLENLKYLDISGSKENAVIPELLVPVLHQLPKLEELMLTQRIQN